MRVKLFPADSGGCGFYRMTLPAETAAAQMADLDVAFITSPQDENAITCHLEGPIGNTHVVSVHDPECDVLVLQRPMYRELVEAIPLIQGHGTAVVVEIDDDFETVHPKNPAHRGVQPSANANSNVLWFNLAITLCDLVTASTPRLVKRYGKHGRVRELPNYVPAYYLEAEQTETHDVPLIGWAGNPKVHPGDLPVVGEAVRDLVEDGGAGFRAIGGAAEQTFRELHLNDEPGARLSTRDWMPIEALPGEIAQLDIGIVPLASTPFNQAKSWIKGLEYAACGVPFVASPLQQYKALHGLGAGELADLKDDWERKLRRLVEDPVHRKERATQAHAVAEKLTMEQHAEKWAQAWSDALAARR